MKMKQPPDIASAPPSFTGPNVLMTVGLVPFLLWAYAVASTAKYGLGLSDLFLGMFFGVAAYFATMMLSGVGVLWADRLARKAHARAPTATRILVWSVAVVLVAPWLLLIARMISNSHAP